MNFDFENIEKELELLDKIKDVELEKKEQYIEELNRILTKYKKYIEINVPAHKIIENFILVKLLKEEHIKLTQDQNQKNLLYRKQLEDSIEKLKKISIIVKQIENKEIYINSEIIELLCIEKTVENLKQIIIYNKKVNHKKTFKTDEEIEEKIEIQEEKEEIIEQKILTNKKKKKKRIQKQKEEIVFTTKEEIINYVKNKYEIEIQEDLYDKDIEEIAQIINIIEQKHFIEIKKEFLENILKYGTLEDIERIQKILKESQITLEDLYELVTFDDFEESISHIFDMTINPFYKEKEEQIKVLKLDKRVITRILNNTLLLLIYKMHNVTDNKMLTKKINAEYIDKIIECGFGYSLRKDANELFDYFNIPTMENSYSKRMEDIIYKRYYGLIKELEQSKKSRQEFDDSIKETLENEMKQRGLPIQSNITNMIKLLLSKNEILKREQKISEASLEHFGKSISSEEIFNNTYIKYLETKYLKASPLPTYTIPIDKTKFGIDNILVSRNKVARLIGEHILQGDEITLEIVINCIFYNMPITDEILENAMEIITSELKKLDQYQKTNIKK